jgi:predicted nuclease of predicted toxin-antitoxin system
VKLLVDMNLSPDRVPFLKQAGFDVLHWSSVGDHKAPDGEIMQWARDNQSIVFTHDLDFGILLAHTRASGPSVIQVRAQDVSPAHLRKLVLEALSTHGAMLENGALLTVEEAKSRVRLLPLKLRDTYRRSCASRSV